MAADPQPQLSHVDQSGAARMVDVTEKSNTDRVAVAEGWVDMSPSTLELIQTNGLPKGDVLAVARASECTHALQLASRQRANQRKIDGLLGYADGVCGRVETSATG